MCRFTYLGYGGCEEPERHYFIRREKCVTKAHLKHWCDPHEQEEAVLTEHDDFIDMACPMCADVAVIYDQPLLEIAHSRRCVLPAPRYDGVTGQYSGLPRHLVYNSRINRPQIPAKNSSEALVPRPLHMARKQIHQRSASETAVNRIRQREVAADYTLPTARYVEEEEEQQQQEHEMLMLPSATYMPGEEQIPMLPATAYMPPPQDSTNMLPKPLPTPQPMELTPPSSREGSLSPPQNRMGMLMRTIPPGESSRRELESIRERARLAAAAADNSNKQTSRPETPQSRRRPATDRSRSGSESSTSSFGTPNPPPPPPPPPRRKASTASSEDSAASSTAVFSRNGSSVASSRSTSHSVVRRPEHHRKESSASAISSSSSASRTPPQQQQQVETGATDKFTTAALRTIGISIDRTDSPERGRGRQRRERGGSSSERSDSPSVWRPTISPPQLQQDSLGMGSNIASNNNNSNNSSNNSSSNNSSSTHINIVEPLKQRLVPFRPTKSGNTTPNSILATTPRREAAALDLQRPPKTPHPNATSSMRSPAAPLRLYPSKDDDAKVASEAFNTMLQEEHRAMAAATKTLQFHHHQSPSEQQQQQQQQQQQNTNNDNGDLESAIEMHLPTVSMQFGSASSNSDPYGTAGVGRAAVANNSSTSTNHKGGLPAAARAGLRRIKTGQVKTVTIASPLRLKRANTEDVLTTPVSATMKVRGGPLFSIAGVGLGSGAGRAQEFEIVHKSGEGEALGKAF
ncbi:hypothetical protein BD289DRAFT_453190 [Coniella lustricola]|uniref:Uncharacterized protein n=1 Tax=Coniella lustricola TaxID=2025994 RepID=A0A2T3A8C8_9PEZI|nr:hypothetical protein BD289DRAFT_453190 [Coniella lustricola]